jgi:hypothetical protein
MNRYFIVFYLFAILLLIVSFSCEGNLDKMEPSYTTTVEDHSQGYTYPTGYYYEYKVSAYNDIIDPDEMLNKLKMANIIVQEAWYRHYLSGCSAPGSNMTTTAIYPNVLILRLKSPNQEILKYGFEVLDSPDQITCGYSVIRYYIDT